MTGIYLPDIGGPALYAKELKDVWSEKGYSVKVKYFSSVEKILPTGLRHLYFVFKSIFVWMQADVIVVLDTFSVGIGAFLLSYVFKKKYIIRTGGDFLWEMYVERTGKKVLLKNFYNTEKNNFNRKEKIIFYLTSKVIARASFVVFSTEWQKNIWLTPYNLCLSKVHIVENCYTKSTTDKQYASKTFLGSTRSLVWKNLDTLIDVFKDEEILSQGLVLDTHKYPQDIFLEHIKKSYAVILVSLGDISPNMILQAIKNNTPFIVTEEIGIKDRIKDIAIFVDPLDYSDIKKKILWLNHKDNYEVQKQKIQQFTFTHSWEDIARELLMLA